MCCGLTLACSALGQAALSAPVSDPLDFPPQTLVAPGQLVVSAPITVSGVAPGTRLSVEVFNGEWSLGCSGVFWRFLFPRPTVTNGDVICVRHVSSTTQPDGVVMTSIGLWPASAYDPDVSLPTFGAFLSNTGSVFDTSPDFALQRYVRVNLRRNVPQTTQTWPIGGFNAPASLSVTNGDYFVQRMLAGDMGRQPYAHPGDILGLGHTTASTWNTTTTTTLTIGGIARNFVSRTFARRRLVEGDLLDFDGNGVGDMLKNDGTILYIVTGPTTSRFLHGDFVNWRFTHVGDFDGDGISDLLWRHATRGETAVWLMDGGYPREIATLVVDGAWRATHTADFDGDDRSDVVWTNDATGETVLWLMSGLGFRDSATLLVHPDWRVDLVADLNGDGKSDLVWRNRANGSTAAWLMDGKAFVGGQLLVSNPDWRVVAKGDFDDDGKDDLVWYNATTGHTAVWLMDGVSLPFKSAALLSAPIGWPVLGTGDFNSDGFSDLVFEEPSTGAAWISFREGLQSTGAVQSNLAPFAFACIIGVDGSGFAAVHPASNEHRCLPR
jgi:hypothetical protein